MRLTRSLVVVTGLIAICGVLLIGLSAPQPEGYPTADAKELWQFITETSPYRVMGEDGWHFLPGWEGRKEGQSPHGAGIATYVNDIASEAAKMQQTTLPNHAMVVKENYAPAVDGNKQSALWPNAKLVAITVMYKIDGYNPDANDWYWVKYNPDGSVAMKGDMAISGKIGSCIGCHAQGSGAANDYLIGYNLKEMKPAQ